MIGHAYRTAAVDNSVAVQWSRDGETWTHCATAANQEDAARLIDARRTLDVVLNAIEVNGIMTDAAFDDLSEACDTITELDIDGQVAS